MEIQTQTIYNLKHQKVFYKELLSFKMKALLVKLNLIYHTSSGKLKNKFILT